MFFGEIAVIFWLDIATRIFFDIGPIQNPFSSYCRESSSHITVEFRVAPGARAVIDSYGFIFFNFSIRMLRIRDTNLSHRYFQSLVNLTLDVDTGRIWKERWVFFNGLDFFGIVCLIGKLPRKVPALLGVVQIRQHGQFWIIHFFPLGFHWGITRRRKNG